MRIAAMCATLLHVTVADDATMEPGPPDGDTAPTTLAEPFEPTEPGASTHSRDRIWHGEVKEAMGALPSVWVGGYLRDELR